MAVLTLVENVPSQAYATSPIEMLLSLGSAPSGRGEGEIEIVEEGRGVWLGNLVQNERLYFISQTSFKWYNAKIYSDFCFNFMEKKFLHFIVKDALYLVY